MSGGPLDNPETRILKSGPRLVIALEIHLFCGNEPARTKTTFYVPCWQSALSESVDSGQSPEAPRGWLAGGQNPLAAADPTPFPQIFHAPSDCCVDASTDVATLRPAGCHHASQPRRAAVVPLITCRVLSDDPASSYCFRVGVAKADDYIVLTRPVSGTSSRFGSTGSRSPGFA